MHHGTFTGTGTAVQGRRRSRRRGSAERGGGPGSCGNAPSGWRAAGPRTARSGHVQVEPEVAAGEAQADSRAGSVRKLMHLAFVDEVFEAHARNPGVLDCIVGLLGPDVKLYQDQLFMKPARIGSRQPYHQDQPLGFHIEPASELVACWGRSRPRHRRQRLSLVPAGNPQTGCARQPGARRVRRAVACGQAAPGAPGRAETGGLQLPPRARPPLEPGQRQRPAPARLRHALRERPLPLHRAPRERTTPCWCGGRSIPGCI